MSKTRSSPVVPVKNKILKGKQISLGTAMAISLSQTNMSTLKDARALLLEIYLDVVNVIDDDEFILPYHETFSKNPEFPYDFFNFTFYICNNDFKIKEYRNITLTSSSATSMLLMSVSFHWLFFLPFSICFSVLSREGCSDLELPFC